MGRLYGLAAVIVMRILEKFLLLIFTLCLGVLGVGGIYACFDNDVLKFVNYVASLMVYNRWITLIISAALVLVAVLMLFGVVFSTSGKSKSGGYSGVVQVGAEVDNVQISTAAVDCIIQQQKNIYPALVSLETKITSDNAGVTVMLKIVAKADCNIPELTAALQASVKEHLESMVGLHVAAVRVVVADVMQPGAGSATSAN